MAQLIHTTVNGDLKVLGNVEFDTPDGSQETVTVKINNIDYSMTDAEYNELFALAGGE